MKQLNIGDIAPWFSEMDKHKGRKIVLYFYPKDNTPGCTDEACSLRDNYQKFLADGYEIFGVSADSEKSHIGFKAKHQLPFDLIADPEHKIIDAYECWGEKKMYGKTYFGILRKTFVIDENGKIEKIFEKVNTKNHAAQIFGEI